MQRHKSKTSSRAGLVLQSIFILVGFQQSGPKEAAQSSALRAGGMHNTFSRSQNHNNIAELAEKASRDVARVSIKHPKWSWHILCLLSPCATKGTPKSPSKAQSGPKGIHRYKYDINISIIYIKINIRHRNQYKNSPAGVSRARGGSVNEAEQVMATSSQCHSHDSVAL